MDRPHNQKRIVTLHQMLFEMARGNFNNRIPLSPYDDELETLVVLVNMVAEEMKESIFHAGYVNPHTTYRFINQATFVLDSSFSITSFNSGITTVLGFSEMDLLHQPLEKFISPESVEKLNFVKESLQGNLSFQPIVPLHFLTREGLYVSVDCSISALFHSAEIILSFVSPLPQDVYSSIGQEKENDEDKQPGSRKIDALLIQKLYDYILAHLEEPLPSLKALSRLFGTNEYKLKDGFRHFFKTSIYQFYNEERLKRAHLMIQQTDIPLKNISLMNGFSNYPNFSKSFKRRYGYAPNAIQRNNSSFTLEE
ncbi:MAG: helix-turn-helix domain-containing protein [Flavobacterium sp.]|uniref:helix-turn-helix transcriptional regulator n=1 Tax=Flavobacterium sp. TaxID=239 RepID=UPI002618C95E|nr:helix-turn-helix domain-containing protein [Flavobacterium sp.]MDD5152065.1 helix-turn-helix domain-containing protein [Flavobacterium sp.]